MTSFLESGFKFICSEFSKMLCFKKKDKGKQKYFEITLNGAPLKFENRRKKAGVSLSYFPRKYNVMKIDNL